ncbi:MAG: carbon-nitrogen hydrolase family protein [Candidatus Latescibacteria bacterium]|nr:carbon-nitrogen hydrolase family protein [Candidatus Latescibacterota bacterium]
MARSVRIAVCSTPGRAVGETGDEKYEYNLRMAERLLAEASALRADIACLPETFHIQNIRDAGQDPRWHEPLPGGPTFRRMSDAARRHRMYVIAPILAVERGVHRNVAMLFDRNGDYVGGYQKVHLTVAEVEDWGIIAGDTWPVFDLDFGRIGITICFDVMFQEAFRILALKGAEVIFHPTVYSMYGEVGWEAIIQARAIDNCVYVCPVNYGISEDDPWMPGMCLNRSSVIGPDGISLADRGRYWGVALAELDLDRPRIVGGGKTGRENYREIVWKHRRPDTYGELTGYGHWVETGYRNPSSKKGS